MKLALTVLLVYVYENPFSNPLQESMTICTLESKQKEFCIPASLPVPVNFAHFSLYSMREGPVHRAGHFEGFRLSLSIFKLVRYR
jgi:hypothetical protein